MPGFEFFGEEERKEVGDVLQTGILMRYNFDAPRNGHWKAREFEHAICEKLGVKYAQLTSSGTTALMTAMQAMGIGAGCEVIMPTFTFVASFEAVLAVGAIPVLVDIDETLTLDPKAVEKAITPRTKAIMPVHMCGSMADLDPLLEIAKKYNLYLLEDACQSIGGTYKGKYLGTIGDMGTFSFDFVKTVTCGEGGVVMTNNKDWYISSDQYTDHGHDHVGNDRGAEWHPILGLNFRISELQAAVGLAQWRKLDAILGKQRANKKILKEELSKLPDVRFRKLPDETGDNGSFLSIFLPDASTAEAVATKTKEAGIACMYWFNNNWHYIRKWDHLKQRKFLAPLYQEHLDLLPDYATQDYSASDAIMERTLTFPISISWSEEKAKEIATKLHSIIEQLS